MNGYAAVLLAGGAGRRLGGVDKPSVQVAGRPLIERVLAAVADAAPRIVVGPPRPLPDGVLGTREDPPGAGPAAATAAGLALVPDGVPLVALLAADLPFLTAAAVLRLRKAVAATATDDAAVYVDRDGNRQFLCAVWRATALRSRLAASGRLSGQSLKRLYAAANVTEISHQGDPPPWYDCDTGADLTHAERWLAGDGVARRSSTAPR